MTTKASRHNLRAVRRRASVALLLAMAVAVGIVVPVASSAPAYSDAGCGSACTNVSATPAVLASELMQAKNAGRLTEATIVSGSIFGNEIGPIANGTVAPNCTIDTRVLQTLVVVTRTYSKVQLTDLNRWCAHDGAHTCTGAGASPWHCARPAIAIDFGAINGVGLDGRNATSIDLLRTLNSFLPANMHVGQAGCRSGSLAGSYGFSNFGNEFDDWCNHVHIDFSSAKGPMRVTGTNQNPVGNVEAITSPAAGTIAVSGWSYDPDSSSASLYVGVYVDGARLAYAPADVPRADVNRVMGVGGNHGFAVTVQVNPGAHTVAVYATDLQNGALVQIGGNTSVSVSGTKPATNRVYGGTRYDTAVTLSKKAFPSTAPVVYVAAGNNFADSMSAGAAASKAGGPLLLTESGALSGPTQNEIKRLAPKRIVFVGGALVMPDNILATARQIAPGASVERVGGSDRFETSRQVIRSAFSAGSAPVVFVVDGNAWTDGLAAGNMAVYNTEPVLVLPGGAATLDAASKQLLSELGTATVRVVGGPNVFSDAQLSSIASFIPNTARVSGADRFGTAVTVAERTYGTTPKSVWLASGLNFPDGLAAGVPSGRAKAPLLLSSTSCVPQSTLGYIYSHGIASVTIVGGPAALNDSVAALKPCGV